MNIDQKKSVFIRGYLLFIPGVEGEFVLGVTALPPVCCSDSSPNILFFLFIRPRTAGVFRISSRFWSGLPAKPVCCPRGFGGIPTLCWSFFAIQTPPVCPVLLRPNDHFNAMGVISVVTMTMITTAPKTAELITGSRTHSRWATSGSRRCRQRSSQLHRAGSFRVR
jgi:hypothetical protein